MNDQDKSRDQLLDELSAVRRQLADHKNSPDELARLASFPEQNPDPVLEIDDSDRITYLNPTARARFPELPAAGLAHAFFAGLEPILAQLRCGERSSYIREHQVGPFVYDQKVSWLSASRLVRIYAHDITERKKAEEALHQSERKYRRIIENLSGEFFFFTQDLEENTNFIGISGAELTGYTPEEYEQLDFKALVPDTPLNQEATRHRARLFQGHRPPPYQFELHHKDGTLHRFEVIRTPSFDDRGQVAGSEGMVRDVTASHRAAQDLQRANETAQQAQRELIEQLEEKLQTAEKLRTAQRQLITQEKMASLGKLVAGVAHEINSPSGALNSAIDVLGRCADRVAAGLEEASSLQTLRENRQLHQAQALMKATLKNAAVASQRIAHLVKSLSNFAHLDEAEYQVTDISAGLESALALLQTQMDERIEICRELEPLPAIYCAPAQLNQVFMNLLQNARQAIAGAGTIVIATYRREDSIYVCIGDNGRGIAAEQLARIFDFDFSSEGGRIKKGFGLFIDYNIVKDHGGDIDIDSNLGQGTKVTVRLPIRTSPKEAPQPTAR